MPKFNINGLTDAQQQSCMSFMITDAERIETLKERAAAMTGYYVFQDGHNFYVWSDGLQPSDDIRELIADKNPIRAAEKFLSAFFAKSELKTGSPHSQPVFRHKAEPKPVEEAAKLKDNEVIELSLCSFDEFLPEPGKTYRFVKNPGCPVCAQVDLIMGMSRRAQG